MSTDNTMNHIMESCPLAKLVDNSLLQLHSDGDNVVIWLRDMPMKALAKYVNYMSLFEKLVSSEC